MTFREARHVDWERVVAWVVVLALLVTAVALSGCGCPPRAREATRLFAWDVEVVLEGAAPVASLTWDQAVTWERARLRVLENAWRVAEAHR